MRSAEDLEHLGNTTVDKLNYAVYGNNEETVATLLGWADPNDYTPHIVIPDKITFNGKDAFVTTITDGAFTQGWGITGVTIGSNVKIIGMSAFDGCSIQSLIIPQGTRQIGKQAFSLNPLKSVIFENPSSTDVPLVIGGYAFGATDLESFEVPARLRIYDESSFATDDHCNFLFYYNYLSSSPDNKLKQITINPNFSDINRNYSLEIINDALCCVNNENNCLTIIAYPPAASQKSFTIDAPCIDVLNAAMSYNNLETISLNATNGVREGKVNLIIGDQGIGQSAIKNLSLSANGPIFLDNNIAIRCYNLTAYTLSETITNYKVLDGVLYTNNSDKSLVSYPTGKSDIRFTVPEDVVSIKDFAFCANPHIEQVTLPAGLDHIGVSAFYDCKSLRYVIAEGAELSEVGDNAFDNTPFINNAPDGPIMLSDCLVGYKNIPENLVFPSNMRHAAEGIFMYNKTIKSVRFPADMPVIPAFMFGSCSNLSYVEWPKNLEQINEQAFIYANIPNLELPQSCLKIGFGAFANCSNLQSIKIGDFSDNAINGISGSQIEPWAFSWATQCRSIQIGKGFRAIGSHAFKGAGSETESSVMMDIIIPEGVEEIGNNAFSSARNVGRISLPSTLSRLGANSFNFFNTKAPTEVQINRTTPPAELDIDDVSTIETPVSQIFDVLTLLDTTLTIPLDAQPESFTKFSPWNFQHVVKKNLGSIAQVTADPCDLNVNGLTLTSANGAVIELFGIDGKLIDKGVSVTASGHGLHIVKVGNTVKKIIL